MTITIELPDDQAAALASQTTEHGLTLPDWLTKLSAIGHRNSCHPLEWSRCPAVESIPGKLGGAWVFRNTRMPVSVVFENLQDGLTVEELPTLYDGLTKEHVSAVLAFAAQSLAIIKHA